MKGTDATPELPEGVEPFSVVICSRCEQMTQDCECEGLTGDREIEVIDRTDLPAIIKQERERIWSRVSLDFRLARWVKESLKNILFDD